jgi:hypothetical protein
VLVRSGEEDCVAPDLSLDRDIAVQAEIEPTGLNGTTAPQHLTKAQRRDPPPALASGARPNPQKSG